MEVSQQNLDDEKDHDRVQNIKKCEDSLCGYKSASWFVSARRALFQQQDVLVSAERAKLLDEAESDLKCDKSLKHIYDKKFLTKYALNFVNLVNRPTRDVTGVKKGEEQAGVGQA